MRAMVLTDFGPADNFELQHVPTPAPLPSEVLVRVHAVGLNPVDWKTRLGAPTPARAAIGEAPYVLGWEVSGVVESVGHGVHLHAPGDEVFGLIWFPRPGRAYADYVTAPSRQLVRKPSSVGHVEAAALPLAGLTAWHALTEVAQVQPGQRVLIHAAAGGVGHLAVQIARELGAHVIATASASRHDWLRELGAQQVVDYRTTKFEDVVEPVDVVIDLVGDRVDSTSTRSVGVIKPGGILVRVAPGQAPDLDDKAAQAGIRTSTGILVEPDGEGLKQLAALLADGRLSVEVEKTFDLPEVARAHRLGEGDHVRGKIVLTLSE
jgi:NADPH:quinone reductase-like Zn-dependent oxidoreductase